MADYRKRNLKDVGQIFISKAHNNVVALLSAGGVCLHILGD
jgi:hypothetical protein